MAFQGITSLPESLQFVTSKKKYHLKNQWCLFGTCYQPAGKGAGKDAFEPVFDFWHKSRDIVLDTGHNNSTKTSKKPVLSVSELGKLTFTCKPLKHKRPQSQDRTEELQWQQ